MKKTYIVPEVTVYNTLPVGIIASSLGLGNGTVGEEEVLSREDEDDHTPSSPNIWDQGW